jgi:fatty-acyl-CoA synthase
LRTAEARFMPTSTHPPLAKSAANYQPLTPLPLLERAALVHPEHIAIIHGALRINYAEFYARARRLASALSKAGVGAGDTVSVMLANTPPMLEAHFGVPMAGAVLHAINTRLDAATVAFQLDHAKAKIIICDREFAPVMRQALTRATVAPRVIDYDDAQFPQSAPALSDTDYEAFLASGDPLWRWRMPQDEWEAIALNYTSGTTGNPKGAVYHHRGALLMCYANAVATGLGRHPVYLWSLPMYHCNGWCFSWSLALVAGTHVCLRWVRAGAMFAAIAEHGVTHMCGAPIVMATLLNAEQQERRALPHKVVFVTAAAPPPETVLAGMAHAGFDVVHVYGLTEVFGPAVVNEWHTAWNGLSAEQQAALKARQGVRYPALEDLSVMDPATMQRVPADGKTLGEVMFRGNIVMQGYRGNPQATEEAFAGGWFHSGDLGVLHPDGYVQLKDRSKDIIISGGENISSIEIEEVLYKHPAVALCAVVGKSDEKWGETPCAFIELRPGARATADDVIAFCREHLARYKVPRTVVFDDLPKTSTGKIQKFLLRERAKAC